MIVDKYQQNKCKVIISTDEFCESPREQDNLWNLVCNAGMGNIHEGDLSLKDCVERQNMFQKYYVFANVYIHNHSAIRLSLKPFNCPYDSGLGFVAYVSKDQLRRAYKAERVTPEIAEKALDVLRGEIKELENYFNGECYAVTVKDTNGNEIESCGGFFGLDAAKEYAMEVCASVANE